MSVEAQVASEQALIDQVFIHISVPAELIPQQGAPRVIILGSDPGQHRLQVLAASILLSNPLLIHPYEQWGE